MLRPAVRLLLSAAALLALTCAGDGGGATLPTLAPSGPPRDFAMGLSSLPAELNDDAYERAFALAGAAGDVVLIQRTPPWEEMLSDELSRETIAATRREHELALEHDLEVFFAIDPTDAGVDRSQLADLPADLRGAGFADERVRRALLDYVLYAIENYEPTYLAFGVEINTYALYRPEDFEAFLTLYAEAYDEVKARSPRTLVFPILQFERLKGILSFQRPYLPQWDLIDRFEPRIDLLAVSSYPSLIFADPSQIPANYYTEITAHTDRPLALASLGYASGNAADGEEDQAAFVMRVLADAEMLEAQLVVWLLGQDPSFDVDPPFDLLQHIGLLREDGAEKPAWDTWQTAARRPLRVP
jgi:hypothetical protein